MKYAFATLLLPYYCLIAQSSEVFTVKKKPEADKKQYQRVYGYKLFDYDTVGLNSLIKVNLEPVKGLYDSIGLFNATMQTLGKLTFLEFPKFACTAKFKLFKRKADGSFELFYLHSIAVIDQNGKK